ncbi:hypothetical protein JAO82_09720 [Pontibaca sp. S1109L]|uniref:Arginine transporter n=2 Tax=Pontibaca salina TaxID=2795731 RepID=A0A934HSP6_9RHOB|nr:hypothetical protein [Pontibaca salina]MBI6630156.1 hypothetical protein [Pontibaca salina]
MRHTVKNIVSSVLILGSIAFAAPASAGAIDRACRQSDRGASAPQLCGCLQAVANTTLKRSEHRRVAKFFKDPHMAQEVRQSNRRPDADFWLRYRSFGEQVRQVCG